MKFTQSRPSTEDLYSVYVKTNETQREAMKMTLKDGFWGIAWGTAAFLTGTPILFTLSTCFALSAFCHFSHNRIFAHSEDKMADTLEQMELNDSVFEGFKGMVSQATTPEEKYKLCENLAFCREENLYKLTHKEQQYILQQQCHFLIGALMVDQEEYKSFMEDRPFLQKKAVCASIDTLTTDNMLHDLRSLRDDLIGYNPTHPACDVFEDYNIAQVTRHHNQGVEKATAFNAITLQGLRTASRIKNLTADASLTGKKMSKFAGYRDKAVKRGLSLSL